MPRPTLTPVPPKDAPIMGEQSKNFHELWNGWFRNLYNVLKPGVTISVAPGQTAVVQNGVVVGATGSPGFSGTVALAKLTPGGTNGSLTVVSGIITAYVAPT